MLNNKVKVALVDSGIDINHDYLKGNIIGGISFECDNDYIIATDNYEDENGHGTSCASSIKREFDDVEIFVVKVLGKDGRTSRQIFEEALKYLLNMDIRLINLSLSVTTNEMIQDLHEICDELYRQGKIIVCSLANGFEESYPAVFNNVIGVKGFILESENSFWYNKDKRIQCIMDNNPYMNCNINNSYRLFGKCNSQSTAKLTGIIARILSKKYDITFEELNNELENLAVKNDWEDKDFLASKRYPDFKEGLYDKDNSILLGIANVVREVLKLNKSNDDIYKYSLFNRKIGLNNDNCYEVLKKLEEKFDIKFDYLSISRYDFVSIQTLTDLVAKNILNS